MQPVRYSTLRAFAKSPAHYRALLSTPCVPTPAMRMGTLIHSLVLGGDAPVVYEGERRGKAWAEFKAVNDTSEIVTASEMAQAAEVADAVINDPVAGPLLRGPGVIQERRLEWEMDGVACHGRPDSVGATWVADLKTTADSEPRSFRRHAERMNYHAQLSWYRNALALAEGLYDLDAYVVAVEIDPPCAVTVMRLSPSLLDLGETTWRGWWAQLLECESSGRWPGYSTVPVEWELNPWQEETMSDLDFSGAENAAAPNVNPADKYRALKAEMEALGDSLRAERLELLERLRHVDAVLADIAPKKPTRVRKALGTVAEPKPRRARKAEVTA